MLQPSLKCLIVFSFFLFLRWNISTNHKINRHISPQKQACLKELYMDILTLYSIKVNRSKYLNSIDSINFSAIKKGAQLLPLNSADFSNRQDYTKSDEASYRHQSYTTEEYDGPRDVVEIVLFFDVSVYHPRYQRQA